MKISVAIRVRTGQRSAIDPQILARLITENDEARKVQSRNLAEGHQGIRRIGKSGFSIHR
jgi:hypothetical protein